MAKINKKVSRIKDIYNKTRTDSRAQWEFINQKGYDFSNDNQLTEKERISLESIFNSR